MVYKIKNNKKEKIQQDKVFIINTKITNYGSRSKNHK